MDVKGLKLITIGSGSEPTQEIKIGEFETQLKSFLPEPAFVVSFLDDRVLAGRWMGDHYKFHNAQSMEEKYIQRIRVFNICKEFYAWRTSNGLKGRMRTDDYQGNGADVVVAAQVLFGTGVENKMNGFSEIFEKRGTRIFVPFENLTVDEGRNRLFIKTHNYIEYNPACQATYTDCRFVSFTDGKNDLA